MGVVVGLVVAFFSGVVEFFFSEIEGWIFFGGGGIFFLVEGWNFLFRD